jgi:NitT/TauT family transport system permease protein
MAYRSSGEYSYGFKPPKDVFTAFWTGVCDLSFLKALGASLVRAGYGFLLSVLIGVVVGVTITSSRFAQWLIGPLVLGVQSLPSICWMPLAILTFENKNSMILFVVLMGSIGSIVIATRDGLKQVPLTYQRVASTFGASYWQRMFWVYIPSALPVFISGLKQGWSFAWRSLLAGELIQNVIGIGSELENARNASNYSRLFATMILILLASTFVDKVLFSNLERRVRARWGMAG